MFGIAVVAFFVVYLVLWTIQRGKYNIFSPRKHYGPDRKSNNVIPFQNEKAAPKATHFSFEKNLVARNLLNQSEKHFFQILADELPDHHVFPQVSFNALITHAPWISFLYWKRFVRRSFNTKYVDFVLCEKYDLKVLAVVEYDGTGHRNFDDGLRDELLKSAGYRIERFSYQDTPESIRLRFNGFSRAVQALGGR